MKRVSLFLLTISISISFLFCATQKTFTTRDEVYKRVDILCRIAGVTGPSSFSPMSGSALKIALDRIDASQLSPGQQKELSELYGIINGSTDYLYSEEFFKADIGLSANLQVNIANYKDFDFGSSNNFRDRRNDQMLPYRYESPALSFYPQLYFGDYIFIESDFNLKNNDHHMFESSFGWLLTDYNGFSFFGSRYATAYAPELPYHAGASIGNDYINFIIGRYPHSIGTGITGNLVVGDNFIYQEISNLSLMSNLFTYNISITRFDQQLNIKEDSGLPNYLTLVSRNEFSGEQQFRVVHRFDLNILDRIRFALDMTTIYNSNYGFDIRFFYPFVIGHNYYNYDNYVEKKYFDEANNMMGFNLDIAITKGLSLSAQFALDQFQTYFENKESVPSAYAVLCNLKYSTELFGGILSTWAEGVYTNPYVYLNGKIDSDGWMDFNLDYVVGYHVQYVSDFGYSGYQFGPDTIVFSLGSEYFAKSNWKIGLNLLYRAQGRKGFYYYTRDVKETVIDMSNAFFEEDYEDRITGILSTGFENAEHLIQFKVGGSYLFDSVNLELFGMGCINSYFNYMLEQGRTKIIPQFSFGVKWNGL